MNEQNLRKIKQSNEEAVRNGSKGGKKSGEARRKKREMRTTLETLMKTQIPASMNDLRSMLSALGVDEKLMDYNTAIGFALITKAVNGDTKAYEVIRDTLGEKNAEKVDVSGVDCTLKIPASIEKASLEELRAMSGVEVPTENNDSGGGDDEP